MRRNKWNFNHYNPILPLKLIIIKLRQNIDCLLTLNQLLSSPKNAFTIKNGFIEFNNEICDLCTVPSSYSSSFSYCSFCGLYNGQRQILRYHDDMFCFSDGNRDINICQVDTKCLPFFLSAVYLSPFYENFTLLFFAINDTHSALSILGSARKDVISHMSLLIINNLIK